MITYRKTSPGKRHAFGGPVSAYRELASITVINDAGWRTRFALAEDGAHGPHVRSRVLEVTDRDYGRMAVHGQTTASPLAPGVFAEAAAKPAAAFAFLRDWAIREGHALDPDEPVGLKEVAARLGVSRTTVGKWRTRGALPQPTWRVGGHPAWRWAVIVQWAQETGRETAAA